MVLKTIYGLWGTGISDAILSFEKCCFAMENLVTKKEKKLLKTTVGRGIQNSYALLSVISNSEVKKTELLLGRVLCGISH